MRGSARSKQDVGPSEVPLPLITDHFLQRLRLAVPALLVLALASRPAHSAEGIFLNWNDCPLGPVANADRGNTCTSDLGTNELIVSFSLAQPVDSVFAVEITLDIQHAEATIPAWWHFDTTPCRNGSLKVDSNFSSLSSCVDMWNAEPTSGGLAQFTVGLPRGQANQVRVKITLAVPPEQMRTLGTTSTYYAARLVIDDLMTTGPDACAGCGTPACLVLNAVLIGRPPRPPGAPSANVLLETPGPGHPNWVTWQGGAGANCGAVPARSKTWGQIKALYR